MKKNTWEDVLSCAVVCGRCNESLAPSDPRILSVYDNIAICMNCKKAEEVHEDYADQSKSMIGQCLAETEVMLSDPGGYCYHHFYPYTCKS